MAKVNNVGLNITSHQANPFRTSRDSHNSTNPFSNVNFEGNTLPYADVFEGFKPSFKGATPSNKLKLITSSVAGSMTKIRSMGESITAFAKRIGTVISNAWSYAKNTNIEIVGLKNISELSEKIHNAMSYDIGKGLSDSISGIKKGISDKISFLNTDVTDITKGISEKWNCMIEKIHHSKISKDTSVAELHSMLEHELSLSEVA